MTIPKSILQQLTDIDNFKESLLGSSYLKIIEQFKQQETHYQKLLKNSLSIPESALQVMNELNASKKLFIDSLDSQFKN